MNIHFVRTITLASLFARMDHHGLLLHWWTTARVMRNLKTNWSVSGGTLMPSTAFLVIFAFFSQTRHWNLNEFWNTVCSTRYLPKRNKRGIRSACSSKWRWSEPFGSITNVFVLLQLHREYCQHRSVKHIAVHSADVCKHKTSATVFQTVVIGVMSLQNVRKSLSSVSVTGIIVPLLRSATASTVTNITVNQSKFPIFSY